MKTKMFLLFSYMAVLTGLALVGCFDGVKPLSFCDYMQSFYGVSGVVLGAMGFGFVLTDIAITSSDNDKVITDLAMLVFGFAAAFIVAI